MVLVVNRTCQAFSNLESENISYFKTALTELDTDLTDLHGCRVDINVGIS